MTNKKGYQKQIITNNEERFGNYYCYHLFWVAVGYYLWKKILTITGYRFHPTDFELLHFYLHNKNLGRDSLVQAIAEVEDICGLEPWELPGHSNIHSGDQVWYFFYRPNYKYRNSTRIKRTTNQGYWKPTGNFRKVMSRDLETEIGKKRTLVFYKGRVGDNIKNKTGWIMHEYELTATLPNQTFTFVLCKLKKKFGKAEVPCIEEGQSNQYLPPTLGNYLANNEAPAEAARCLMSQSDPNEILAKLQEFNAHEGVELPGYRSTESWNSYLIGDHVPNNESSNLPFNSGNPNSVNSVPNNESSNLPFNSGNPNSETTVPNDQLDSSEVPMEQEVHQDQSGTTEQDINEFGKLVPADNERSNQHNLVLENDGSTSSNLEIPATEDSVQMDMSNMAAESMDELFEELGALPQVQENGYGEALDDWISVDIFRKFEIPNLDHQSSTNEDQNTATANGGCGLSFAGIVESPDSINHPSRKRSRLDHDYDSCGTWP
ncbi:No apical meristem (NAM) protein [Corchorus olitorius]|uniref:No apical meristem (NAM) protein n=1 Tax=Corchorus olitorius TaxID=93759 RepID=A0A1R3IIH2_9ROSI|nr:No apical meristem (NAM) protein [Corchorus olitorius]